MEINGYVLVSEAKLDRALNGTIVDQGRVLGGVGKDATPEAILAEYDKLGGLVLKDGLKVKLGSFYDFKKKQARKEPEVSFEVSLDGDILDVSEEEAKTLDAVKAKKEEIKKKKSRKEVEKVPKKKIKMKDPRDDE